MEDVFNRLSKQPQIPEFPNQQDYDNYKKELIDEVNDQPEVKENKIKAVDEEKDKIVSHDKYIILIIASVVGVVSILIIAIAIGYWAYVGGFSNPISLACGNTTVQTVCPEMPECIVPTCPSCPDCPDLSCPDITIKNYINGST